MLMIATSCTHYASFHSNLIDFNNSWILDGRSTAFSVLSRIEKWSGGIRAKNSVFSNVINLRRWRLDLLAFIQWIFEFIIRQICPFSSGIIQIRVRVSHVSWRGRNSARFSSPRDKWQSEKSICQRTKSVQLKDKKKQLYKVRLYMGRIC